MMWFLAAALALTAMGAEGRGRAGGWFAWCAALAFAVVVLQQPRIRLDAQAAAVARVPLGGTVRGARTAALVAAASAAPAADHIVLQWTGPLPIELAAGPVGSSLGSSLGSAVERGPHRPEG